MAYLKINHDELLNKIVSDPITAMERQLATPAAATCSLLRAAKKMRGIFDRLEQQELSIEQINFIRYLAEHDYLAYLTLLDRFDLIREHFWDKDLFGPQLALIEELEKERANKEYQQELLLSQERTLALNKQQMDKLTREQEQRKNEEKALINMEMYQYFKTLEQHINTNFYEKQIEVYTRAYQGRAERIDRAITIANNDPNMSSKDKKEINQLLKDYERERKVINLMPTRNLDGSVDHKAVERKYNEAKRVDEKYAQLFNTFLENHQDNPDLAELLTEERIATQQCKDELAANEAIRDQELAEIAPYLENTREALEADLEFHMNESATILNQCDLRQMSVEQKAEFKNSLKKLNEHQMAFSQAPDKLVARDSSKKYVEEIKNMREMVKPPVLSSEASQKFDRHVELLSRMENSLNSAPISQARDTS